MVLTLLRSVFLNENIPRIKMADNIGTLPGIDTFLVNDNIIYNVNLLSLRIILFCLEKLIFRSFVALKVHIINTLSHYHLL